MNYSSRFFLYAPLTLFLLLAAGVGIYWWQAASALSKKLDDIQCHGHLDPQFAIPGVCVSFGSKTISGFPFNLDVVFSDVSVSVQTPHGPSVWRSEKFALHALTYGRDQMLFEAAGKQLLGWTDLKGARHTMPFEVGALRASAIEGAHGLSRLDIDLVGFGSPALTATRAQLHARVAPKGDAIDLFADADGVHLSPPLASLFGPDLATVKLDASAAPGRAFAALRDGGQDWVGALEAWRGAGGALAVKMLEIDGGGASAIGKGMLGLDDGHFVGGYLDFKVAGIETLLRRPHGAASANAGVGGALFDRAGRAGTNEAGLLGAVVGFHGGAVSLGDETATTEEKLY